MQAAAFFLTRPRRKSDWMLHIHFRGCSTLKITSCFMQSKNASTRCIVIPSSAHCSVLRSRESNLRFIIPRNRYNLFILVTNDHATSLLNCYPAEWLIVIQSSALVNCIRIFALESILQSLWCIVRARLRNNAADRNKHCAIISGVGNANVPTSSFIYLPFSTGERSL